MGAGGERWDADDELTDAQLAAMDKLWNAQRYDGVGDDEAGQVEALVRAGRVAVAYRRLAQARRAVAKNSR